MENPYLKVVTHLASLGYSDEKIAQVIGINFPEFRYWKEYQPDFLQALNSGRFHASKIEKCKDEIEETPEQIHHSLETDRKHAFIAEMNRQKEENPDNSFRWEFSRDDGRTISEQREDKLKELLGE